MSAASADSLPYAGLRVVELTHMVMGPTCGMILADMGAEVIKVEPLKGDSTRHLLGSGAGFFPTFNRNKKSLAVDLQDARGREVVLRLAARADVFSENFKAGAMARLGLDYASLARFNPRLVYVSHKGFLPGPYEHRTALDEVVQMMGGLAYMTGPEGRPLRAGASVNDIMGGMFGAIGAMGALAQREKTGQGQEVQSALFENNVFLVGQHMLQSAISGQPARPMPVRQNPWAVYDIFTVKDGGQIFLAAVSDPQWQTFCDVLGLHDLKADPSLATNNQRVQVRPQLIATLRERLAPLEADDIAARMEAAGLPFAPILRPDQLLDDPHLRATGGLADLVLTDGERAGQTVQGTLLPFTLQGHRPGVRLQPPRAGEHGAEVLREAGLADDEIAHLQAQGILGNPSGP